MWDLFLCDYVEDSTLPLVVQNMDLLLSELEKDISTVFTLFHNKYSKANSTKSHLLTRSINVMHINCWKGGYRLNNRKYEE